VGNLIIAGVIVGASWVFFLILGLDFPFLIALLSGMANLVPYLGALVAWIPLRRRLEPVAIARRLRADCLGADDVSPDLVERAVPPSRWPPGALERHRRHHLASLLGMARGAAGFLLAIPITAAMKVVCDHVESWRPAGEWRGTNDSD
jgi:putative permease